VNDTQPTRAARSKASPRPPAKATPRRAIKLRVLVRRPNIPWWVKAEVKALFDDWDAPILSRACWDELHRVGIWAVEP
jgi:hypothetical protein